ncbi:hypothetical protein GCM10009636_27330 [Arthrobacter koreensis]|uniref:Uncharacterized protein n=1 Tax=Arthrobacter gandavensis TaxID=169960 RepID=A0ABN2PD53_9MICC
MGAARRLATELVVIIASAIQEIHWVLVGRVRAAAVDPEPSIGMSAVLMVTHLVSRAQS